MVLIDSYWCHRNRQSLGLWMNGNGCSVSPCVRAYMSWLCFVVSRLLHACSPSASSGFYCLWWRSSWTVFMFMVSIGRQHNGLMAQSPTLEPPRCQNLIHLYRIPVISMKVFHLSSYRLRVETACSFVERFTSSIQSGRCTRISIIWNSNSIWKASWWREWVWKKAFAPALRQVWFINGTHHREMRVVVGG